MFYDLLMGLILTKQLMYTLFTSLLLVIISL